MSLNVIRVEGHPEGQDATCVARVAHADGDFWTQGHHPTSGKAWTLYVYDKAGDRPTEPIFFDDDTSNTNNTSPIIVASGGSLTNDGFWPLDDDGYNFRFVIPHEDEEGTLLAGTVSGDDQPFIVGDLVEQAVTLTQGYVTAVPAANDIRVTGGPWDTTNAVTAVNRAVSLGAPTGATSTVSFRGGRTYRAVFTLLTGGTGTKGDVGSTRVVFEIAVDTV